MTFREMGQQAGRYFIAVKKLARGGTTNHEVFMICQFLFRLAYRQRLPLTNQIPTRLSSHRLELVKETATEISTIN